MERYLIAALLLVISTAAHAKTATVPINKIDEKGVGAMIGVLQLEDTEAGLRITPSLNGLPPGPHGFHVHSHGDCAPGDDKGKQAAGMAAGGHLDPKQTEKHLGPESTEGHLGDLPVLMVDDKGSAQTTVVAPHLKVDDVQGHSFMIHAGGDNYSDQPAPLGGGGARIACGKL
jgi:Cu-Zn family superoxide dismutase